MNRIKPYLGFLPAIVVGIPCGVASIHQALFCKGWCDGLNYVIASFFAFVVGGILNAGFLSYVALSRRSYFNHSEHRHLLIARAGIIIACLLLVAQICMVVYLLLMKHAAL